MEVSACAGGAVEHVMYRFLIREIREQIKKEMREQKKKRTRNKYRFLIREI